MIEQVTSLEEILEPRAGQVVFVKKNEEDPGSVWRFDPTEGWQEVKADDNMTVAAMSTYDMNKQIINQLPKLSNKDLKEKTKLITKYVSQTMATYYMLLCNDLNYYTVLANDPTNAAPNDYFGDVLLECLDFWDVKAIDLTEEDVIEIWVSVKDNPQEVYAMYFFPYDNGVIACR